MKIFGLLIGLAMLSGCSADNKEDEAVRHGYYYFPRPNIYYDTADKTFIYFDTAGKEWQTGNLPPVYIQSDLGKSILIDSPPQPVWLGNKEHQMVYSARLYADSSDFKKPPPPKKPVVAQKKTDSAATSADESSPDKRKKTRVGELIERIFGNKNDRN